MAKTFFKSTIYYDSASWNMVANYLLRNKISYYRLEAYDNGVLIGIRFKKEADYMAFYLKYGNDPIQFELDIYGITMKEWQQRDEEQSLGFWSQAIR